MLTNTEIALKTCGLFYVCVVFLQDLHPPGQNGGPMTEYRVSLVFCIFLKKKNPKPNKTCNSRMH